jgi:hypothetical protein
MLSRFISRLVKQALLFFKLLRKSEPFVWTKEAKEALQELKWYLMSPLIMVAPEPGEILWQQMKPWVWCWSQNGQNPTNTKSQKGPLLPVLDP